MKTKTFIIVCLLLGFGMTQLSAQNGKDGTGSVTGKHIWDTYYIDIPVNCNNAVVDRLFGSVMMHQILHYKDGVLIWYNAQFEGEATSQTTGEVFKVKDIWKLDIINSLIGTGHCILKGSYGNEYILTYSYDLLTDIYTFHKAICH